MRDNYDLHSYAKSIRGYEIQHSRTTLVGLALLPGALIQIYDILVFRIPRIWTIFPIFERQISQWEIYPWLIVVDRLESYFILHEMAPDDRRFTRIESFTTIRSVFTIKYEYKCEYRMKPNSTSSMRLMQTAHGNGKRKFLTVFPRTLSKTKTKSREFST